MIKGFTERCERTIYESKTLNFVSNVVSKSYYLATFLPPVYVFDATMRYATRKTVGVALSLYERAKENEVVKKTLNNVNVKHKLEAIFSRLIRVYVEKGRKDRLKLDDEDKELGSEDEEADKYNQYVNHYLSNRGMEGMGTVNMDINLTAFGRGPQQYERDGESEDGESDDSERMEQGADAAREDNELEEEDEEDGLPFLSFNFSSDQAIPM